MKRAADTLAKAIARNYNAAKKDHIAFYRKYFGRVALFLGEDRYTDVPTDTASVALKKPTIPTWVANILSVWEIPAHFRVRSLEANLLRCKGYGMINCSPHGTANIPVTSTSK